MSSRVAFVTGCGKRDGMGRAIALTLAASGVAVAVTDRRPGGVPWGITVNAIAPGMVATSRAVLSLDPDLDVEAEVKRRGEMLAVGRPGYPDDIVAAVAYLVSDGASYMTGQTLVLDGGGSAPFANRPPTAESGSADGNSVSNGN